ncbi:9935_t:CDS:2, partial [Acaulospora morrowiae]
MADKLPYTPRTPNTPSYYKETEFSNEFTSSLINSNDIYKDANKALWDTINHYQLQLTALRKDHQIVVLECKTEERKKNLLEEFLPSDNFNEHKIRKYYDEVYISPDRNYILTKPAYIQEDIIKLDKKHEKIPIVSDRYILFHSKIIHDFYNSKAERQKELLMKNRYDGTLYWVSS